MTPGRTPHPATPSRVSSFRASAADWIGPASLSVVFLALVSLVVLPWSVSRRTTPLYGQLIESIAPARGFLTRISHSLSIEGTAFRDALASAPAVMPPHARTAMAVESAATDSLEALLDALPQAGRTAFDDMKRRQGEWRAAVAASLRSPTPRSSAETRVTFERLIDAVVTLDETLAAEGQGRRAELLGMERTRSRLATMLALFALVAALIVASLARRMRTYARVLEDREAAVNEAVTARERLLRGVSHDLKNPLHAIDGHAQLLADQVRGPMTHDQQDSVTRIRGAVRTMNALIADLLELAHAEAGQLRIEKVEVDIADLVRDIVEQFRPVAELSGHVVAPVDLAGPLLVRTDASRVRQILGNLLTNATKYTPAGASIAIAAGLRRDGSGSGPPWLVVDVRDSGEGIPVDQQASIFTEFTRQAIHQQIAGSGLGLSISRRIARLLGGDLTVFSRPPDGAVFSLWLPAPVVAPPGGDRRAAERRRSPRENHAPAR